MLNKIVVRGTIVFFVLISAVLIVPSFVNWDSYKVALLNQINMHTGLVVSIDGPIKLSLLPNPHLSLSNIIVQNPRIEDARNQLPPLVKLKHLSLHVDIMPLLQKQISISSIKLIEPFVFIEKEEAIKTEPVKSPIKVDQQNLALKENSTQQLSFNIAHLSIVDGTVILNNVKEKKRNEIEKINLSGAFSFDKGFDLKVGANTSGVGINGSVKGGAFMKGMPQAFDAVLDVTNGDLKGEIRVSSALKDGSHVLSAKSDAIKLPVSFSIGDHVIDFTKGISFNINALLKDDTITIQNLIAKLADITLTSRGIYQLKENKGELSLSLSSSLLNASGKLGVTLGHLKPALIVDLVIPKLDEQAWTKSMRLSDSAKSSQSSEVPQNAKTERWSNEVIDLKALQIVDVEVSLLVNTLKLSGVDANAVKMQVSVNNGVAKIKNLTLNVFGGNVSVSGGIDSHTADLNIAANMVGVDIRKCPGMKDSPVKSGQLNVSANFATKAKSLQSAVNMLSGKTNIQLANGVVEAFDVKQFVVDLKARELSKLKDDFDRKKPLAFNHIRGDFTITNGIMNTQNCEIDINEGVVTTVGAINLPQWTLALKSTINVRADKNIPNLSFNITGALDDPNFAPDIDSMQQALVKIATNQLVGHAKSEVQKRVKEQLGSVIQGEAAEKVGSQVSNALGKLLPGLLG